MTLPVFVPMGSRSPLTLDLDAYCNRIGFSGHLDTSVATLRALHELHPRAIPFENVDVVLGRPISLDVPALASKLVSRRRGGYCFEQNGLFAAVLRELGFDVTPLLGRLRFNVPAAVVMPRTHEVLRVVAEGEVLLVDVGFGHLSLTSPLYLHADGEQSTGLEPRRIIRADGSCVLEAKLGDAWVPLYAFSLEPRFSIDCEVANWFTSTHPESIFRNNLILGRALPDGRVTLRNRELVEKSARIKSTRILESRSDLQQTLQALFDLDLAEGEIDAIWRFLTRDLPEGDLMGCSASPEPTASLADNRLPHGSAG